MQKMQATQGCVWLLLWQCLGFVKVLICEKRKNTTHILSSAPYMPQASLQKHCHNEQKKMALLVEGDGQNIKQTQNAADNVYIALAFDFHAEYQKKIASIF